MSCLFGSTWIWRPLGHDLLGSIVNMVIPNPLGSAMTLLVEPTRIQGPLRHDPLGSDPLGSIVYTGHAGPDWNRHDVLPDSLGSAVRSDMIRSDLLSTWSCWTRSDPP